MCLHCHCPRVLITIETIGTPTLWGVTIAGVVLLLVVDFIATRKPHEVSMKEATLWSVFYIALPIAFGIYVLTDYGAENGVNYYTGYIVEKSLSVDNLFVFMLLLTAFAVPKVLQQRVLLFGIIGALVLRGIFIAIGAAALSAFNFVFLDLRRDPAAHRRQAAQGCLAGNTSKPWTNIHSMRSVRLMRKFMPVTDDYRGHRMTVVEGGRRSLTPLALVVGAVLMTDIVFAVDSVPAVYGITSDPTDLRHQRLRAAGSAGALLRHPGSARQARAPQLRPVDHPRLHRRQAGPALGPPQLGMLSRRSATSPPWSLSWACSSSPPSPAW